MEPETKHSHPTEWIESHLCVSQYFESTDCSYFVYKFVLMKTALHWHFYSVDLSKYKLICMAYCTTLNNTDVCVCVCVCLKLPSMSFVLAHANRDAPVIQYVK